MSTKFKVIKVSPERTLPLSGAAGIIAIFDELFEKEGLDKGEWQQMTVVRKAEAKMVVPAEGGEPRPVTTGEYALVAQGASMVYIGEAELNESIASGNPPNVYGVKNPCVCNTGDDDDEESASEEVIPLKPKTLD